jgi:hypothetical protein
MLSGHALATRLPRRFTPRNDNCGGHVEMFITSLLRIIPFGIPLGYVITSSY